MGRPTKYRKEFCERAYKVLAEGGLRCTVCVELGICHETMGRWAAAHPDFSSAVKAGLAASEEIHRQILRRQAQGEIQGGSAAAILFTMKNSHGWTDKREEVVTQDTTLTIKWADED